MSDMTKPRPLFSYGTGDHEELAEISAGWIVAAEGRPAHRIVVSEDDHLIPACDFARFVEDARPAHEEDTLCGRCVGGTPVAEVRRSLPTVQWLTKSHCPEAECLGCGEARPLTAVNGPLLPHTTDRGAELGGVVDCPGVGFLPARGDGRDQVRRRALAQVTGLRTFIASKRDEMRTSEWPVTDLVNHFAPPLAAAEAELEYWETALFEGSHVESARLAVRRLLNESSDKPKRAGARRFMRKIQRAVDANLYGEREVTVSLVWDEVMGL